MSSKITGPLFKWFGSKWMSARHYPAPRHEKIYEPFAGSAGYSLRHYEHSVILYDSNTQLQELWTWLIGEATESNIREIPLNLAIGTDIRDLGLTRGQSLLLKHWQRTNNVGDCWTVSPWGSKPGQWTTNTRARVAEQVGAIKHWDFCSLPWDYTATYFIDPPYQFNYRYKTPILDYTALALQIASLPSDAQVIVCEALGPEGEIPTWLPFRDSHRQVTSRRKITQSHHSRELIWTSA